MSDNKNFEDRQRHYAQVAKKILEDNNRSKLEKALADKPIVKTTKKGKGPVASDPTDAVVEEICEAVRKARLLRSPVQPRTIAPEVLAELAQDTEGLKEASREARVTTSELLAELKTSMELLKEPTDN